MAAYAALASLAQSTHPDRNQNNSFFSIGAEEKIRTIHEYVIFLLSFLEDFPEKAKRWEGRIRDLAHETEDIIEQFMWQQSYHRRMKLSSVKFEEQLRNVTEKFCLMAGDMTDERPAYSPIVSSSSSSSRVAPTGNGAVVGLDDDAMAIKDRLCGLSSKLQVVPIVGMGGIGKTTLARNVYDDPLIMHHFYIRVWITISQDYSAHRTLLSLLDSMKWIEEQMSGQRIDDCTMAEKVYKNLKGRRYLIVMDDVWSTKVWDDVRNIFPDDGNGSRIMLTTRLADLAAYPDSNSPPHEMRLMNDSQMWDLLKRKVFGSSNCPLELEDVGREIARSCVGLPLAVVLVAGFLSEVDKTQSSWEEISKNVRPNVGEELERILSLSYTHLPHHLRPCFLFIGMFPEDENIRASKLIRLWFAEGFLKHDNGCSKSLEEEAEECLEDLEKRNLVIVNSRKSNGKIKNFGLHDMVRDLCIKKAHEEKFLRVIDGRVVPQSLINERRISLRISDIDDIWCPTIHTMLCFQLQNFPSWPAFLRRFRLLRVFDWSHNTRNYEEIPSQLFELFHLRYLALICYYDIPSSISNLMNLQTLIILQNSSTRPTFNKWKGFSGLSLSLPLEIWGMPQLRHLIVYHLCMLPHLPNGSNLPLENLQTLSYIKNLEWNEKILQMIPNVKTLGLVYHTNGEFHLHLLKHLHSLEKLEIYGFHGFSWMGRKPTFPSTLKKLILVGGRFPWEDMSIIGSLPNLQVLKLRGHTCNVGTRGHVCNGETWETADGGFPQLRYLLIDTSCLWHWDTENIHFPRLKCLVLLSCHFLREIPEGVGEIPTLELIEVGYSNMALVKSARQMIENQRSYGNYALHFRVIGLEEELMKLKAWKILNEDDVQIITEIYEHSRYCFPR